MRLLKKTIISLLFIFHSSSFAANTNAFIELDKATAQINQPQNKIKQEFHAYINQRFDEYEQWREDYTKELDKKRQVLIEEWGRAEVSDQMKDVEYTEDDTVRKTVDYNNNTATISFLVDASVSDTQAKKRLSKQMSLPDGEVFNIQDARMLQHDVDYSIADELKERDFVLNQTQAQMNEYDVQAERLINASTGAPSDFIYERAYKQKKALLDEAKRRIDIISKLYQTKRKSLGNESTKAKVEKLHSNISTPVTVNNIEMKTDGEMSVVEKVEKAAKPLLTKAEEANSATKKVISYKISLPNNNLSKRAKEYEPLALKESKRWSIDVALIMAIMHSESAFRPQAKSNVPAFGLMQIVPTSAGHDVNRKIRHIDAPMSISDLYQPIINVETGTAYLHILDGSYLKDIKNEKSRLYCMIAAYNTGAGNVARAFNTDRSTNIRVAAKKINQMTPENVYKQLITKLPYDETKTYLKKVSSRIALYQ